MRVFHLNCEEVAEVVRELEAGDVVYLTGKVVTARDRAHMRIVELLDSGRKSDIPEEVFSCPIYHCGPLLRRGKKGIEVVSAGPTTSARMNPYAPKLLELTSCPVIIGKGGMGEEVRRALMGKGVYLAFPGGAGALAADRIENVEKVYWEDLGMAEAVYVFRVRNFGPCVVGIDSKGNSLYSFS